MKIDIHYLFSPRHAKWIIFSLIFLFSSFIIIEFASLFFSTPGRETTKNLQTNLLVVTKQNSMSYILNSSLFGVYVPNDLNEGNVKKSMLDVTLVGILLSNKEEDSQIILRSASGNEKGYKIGDKIPGGALIKRIKAGGVLVERNGTLESLTLPKNDLIFEPMPRPLKEE